MSLAVKVYTAFKDEEEKARVLAEIFDLLEEKILDQSQLARSDELKESHLQLQLEIEKVRSDLQLEIGKNRTEIEKVRRDLQIDIAKVRSDLQLEIEKNRTAIEMTKTELARLMNRQVVWIIGSVSFVIGMLKPLDYILK